MERLETATPAAGRFSWLHSWAFSAQGPAGRHPPCLAAPLPERLRHADHDHRWALHHPHRRCRHHSGPGRPTILRPLRLLRHRRVHRRYPEHEGRLPHAGRPGHRGPGGRGDRLDRGAAGAQAPVLLPGSRHHRPGSDLPGAGATTPHHHRVDHGTRPRPDSEHLRVRLQHQPAPVLPDLGRGGGHHPVHRPRPQVPRGPGAAGHRHQRGRLQEPRCTYSQLEAPRLRRQRGHLRTGRWPLRLRQHGGHSELLHLHRRHPPDRHDATWGAGRYGARSSGPSS